MKKEEIIPTNSYIREKYLNTGDIPNEAHVSNNCFRTKNWKIGFELTETGVTIITNTLPNTFDYVIIISI